MPRGRPRKNRDEEPRDVSGDRAVRLLFGAAARNAVTARCAGCGQLAQGALKGWVPYFAPDPRADNPGEFRPLVMCPVCIKAGKTFGPTSPVP